MHTEMPKLGKEKDSKDKNAHYNVCMVLKINQHDAIVLILQARKAHFVCKLQDTGAGAQGV